MSPKQIDVIEDQRRLLTPLNSGSATKRQTVEAVLTAPLFSPERKLVLPEGTRLSGVVVGHEKSAVIPSRRPAPLTFQKADLPAEAAGVRSAGTEAPPLRVQTALEAAEGGGKVWSRWIQKAGSRRRTPAGAAHLGVWGGSGWGLLGAAAAQDSRSVGAALGFYGLAWPIYTNVIARGGRSSLTEMR